MKELVEKVTRSERRSIVAALYPEASTAELSSRFDVSDVTIRNDLRSLKIPMVARGLTPGQRRHATRMRRAGKSLREVARTLGCNYGTLCRYLETRDVPRPPSNRDFGPNGDLSEGRLTLGRAAKAFGVAPSLLRRAAEERIVRAEIIDGAGTAGRVYLFDTTELEADLEKLGACAFEGCTRRASLGSSGGCVVHGHALVQMGKPLTPRHRANVSRGRRRWWSTADGAAALAALRTGDFEEAACFACSGALVRRLKDLRAAAARGSGRQFCRFCQPRWSSALSRALAKLDGVDPKSHPGRGALAAFLDVVEIAEMYEETIRGARPRPRHRPHPIAVDLAIQALHQHGFSDASATVLFRKAITARASVGSAAAVNDDYVKTRRKLRRIRRAA